MSERFDSSEGVVTRTRDETKKRTKPPRMWRVLLHNDDYTTRDFVVEVLKNVFHKSQVEAETIMLNVHHKGVGVAGVYTRDIAQTKALTVEHLARNNGFPLRLSLEPEE